MPLCLLVFLRDDDDDDAVFGLPSDGTGAGLLGGGDALSPGDDDEADMMDRSVWIRAFETENELSRRAEEGERTT